MASLLPLLLSCFLIHQQISTATVNAASNVHIVYMGENHQEDPNIVAYSHHDMLTTLLGSKEAARDSIVYSYKHGFDGFAAKLTESQARLISEFPGVVRVMPNHIFHLQTTRSWDYLGLDYRSPANLLSASNMGDGVIIGVLDTGIWPESESFNDEGLGPIPSRWRGVCEEGELFNSTNCNNKIIGARWYIQGFLAELGEPFNTTENFDYISPRDALGHGTHTSFIAAGAFIGNASYKGLGLGVARGGAPKARLAMYKVCWNVLGGECTSADMLKAFDDAIHDRVDVLSLSIGATVPLYSDVDEHDGIATGAFHATAQGITVVCAAGNDGPAASSVVNTAPWILTVGASTIDRAFPTSITLGSNHTFMGQAMFNGVLNDSFTGLVFPEGQGLQPVLASACEALSLENVTVAGNVLLCFTRVAHRSAAINASSVVKASGGVGVIVAKDPSNSIAPCSDFPCIQVDYEIGQRILYYIRSTSSPMVKLSSPKTLVGQPLATKLAYFSSRGPSSLSPAILKPDIAAPGVNILAASSPLDPVIDNGFAFHTGTSMACPHVSGIVALIKSLHPDWSPAAIKSALVTTASTEEESGELIFAEGRPRKLADPFDYGGGIVNPNKSTDPGIIYDMGTADYVDYLCSMGYNKTAITRLTENATTCPEEVPSTLNVNLPTITIPNLKTSVAISRTVTNVGPVNSIYKAIIEPPSGIEVVVEPPALIFNATMKKLTFKITFFSKRKVHGGYSFGSLSWSDGKHVARSPISVRTEIFPSYADIS